MDIEEKTTQLEREVQGIKAHLIVRDISQNEEIDKTTGKIGKIFISIAFSFISALFIALFYNDVISIFPNLYALTTQDIIPQRMPYSFALMFCLFVQGIRLLFI